MERIMIFSRHQKSTKQRWIESLGTSELLNLPEDVFQRILKEVGKGAPRERTRRLPINGNPGNDWNSEVTEIYRTSGAKIYLSVYHQLSSTDTTMSVLLSEFLKPGDWRGVSKEIDRYGGSSTKYCIYTPGYKAEVIRAILKTYLDERKSN